MFGFKKKHDSRAIANIFVDKARKAGEALGIMTLVKYVYLAQGWTLGYTGRPLIRHHVEAWKYGPVVPEVYGAFKWQQVFVTEKAHGYHPEFGEFPAYSTKLNSEEQDIVDKVYSRYSRFDAFQLTDIINKPGTPWDQCKNNLYQKIPHKVITDYYKEMIVTPGGRDAAN